MAMATEIIGSALLALCLVTGVHAGPLDSFTAQAGVYVVDALLPDGVRTVGSAEDCASWCLTMPQRQCVSFNFVPDGTQGGGGTPICELNTYSAHYALLSGRNATYYLRNITANDAPYQAHKLTKDDERSKS
jgi:hypothetical protein